LQYRVQSFCQLLNSGQDVSNQALENVRSSDAGSLERETHEVVSLEERLLAKDAACQVPHVDPSEGVRLARVAPNVKQFRVRQDRSSGIDSEAWDSVFVADGTAMPLS
jgi:hypothetical protein